MKLKIAKRLFLRREPFNTMVVRLKGSIQQARMTGPMLDCAAVITRLEHILLTVRD